MSPLSRRRLLAGATGLLAGTLATPARPCCRARCSSSRPCCRAWRWHSSGSSCSTRRSDRWSRCSRPAPHPLSVSDTGDGPVVTGPDVVVRIRQRPFGITVLDGGCQVAVREAEARAAAARLLSKLDPATGEQVRARSLDTGSVGVAAQVALREGADDEGYAEPNLWTGIGRARSGAGAAIVGDPDQVLATLRAYEEPGIETFILSGYPHQTEADLFARYVLPRLEHGPLRF